MPDQTTQKKIYELFGLANYANKLESENKIEELEQLEQSVSKFILLKALEDLPEEAKKSLASTEIGDGLDLYNFFDQHIANFQERLAEYGRDFHSTINTDRS